MSALFVYILECSDGSYYVGSTDNLEIRLAKHNSGHYGGYTSTRLPVKLVFSQQFEREFEALTAERQIKGWRRAKKKALIDGDFGLLVELSRTAKPKKS